MIFSASICDKRLKTLYHLWQSDCFLSGFWIILHFSYFPLFKDSHCQSDEWMWKLYYTNNINCHGRFNTMAVLRTNDENLLLLKSTLGLFYFLLIIFPVWPWSWLIFVGLKSCKSCLALCEKIFQEYQNRILNLYQSRSSAHLG